ncbi:MAG: hypothetical protein VB133_09555 [Anaeromusa sp.]|uniref:hypothetical protein n=1 Tax=Anaeromusa sp. TaxID=1872520 RepID=UPI002B210A6D|nr:hypothetical protein [Anaeromusa sp.]MEA4835369.1 hypothetical protein [Anaeromusa sp.]
MKKTVPFEFFGENQTIYFDVLRIAELEDRMKESIYEIMNKSGGMKLAVAGLTIGLRHHYPKITPAFVIEKMEEHFEHGGTLEELVLPVAKAISESGIFGKKDEAKEKNA